MIRTVHHVDDFTSPSLVECQDRSIAEPDHVLCVSQPWVERLADEFGVRAELVRNGVDTRRFRPRARRGRARARARRAGLGERFAVLTVGGIEPRKGSLTLLEGFAALRRLVPELDPLLLIAGGTTLFDYRHERERFAARVARARRRPSTCACSGRSPPDAIERLFRAADVFAFPSVKEGFGLAALEALAAELPVVASDLDVFRGFLADGESALLDADRRRRGAGARAGAGRARAASCASACARAGARVARATPGTPRRRRTSGRTGVPGARGGAALMARRSRSPRRGGAATRPTSRRAATGSRSTSPSRPAARTAA